MLFALWYSVLGTAQEQIWRTLYFTPGWQAFFNSFNSIPLGLIILGFGIAYRHKLTIAFSSGFLLHLIEDFLTHRHDAHAHFFPLTNWIFVAASPEIFAPVRARLTR